MRPLKGKGAASLAARFKQGDCQKNERKDMPLNVSPSRIEVSLVSKNATIGMMPRTKRRNNGTHVDLLLNTTDERCETCGQQLWRSPQQKCVRHGVSFCREECLTQEKLRTMPGVLREESHANSACEKTGPGDLVLSFPNRLFESLQG
jgi:hypothetical protein